jgi:hypothetical protein
MGVRQAGLLVVLALAIPGCSGGDHEQAGRAAPPTASVLPSTNPSPTSSSPSRPAASGSTTAPTPSSSTSDPGIPATVKSAGPRVVIEGVVREGVEAGCLVLGGYELVTDSALWHSVLATGEPVQITGYVDKGRVSHCQQGKTLVITDVRP